MTVQELVKTLENVAPDTVVKIGTEAGTFPVRDVWTLGYSGGTVIIVADD